MKYINSYLDFINEELVTKLDPKTHNVFSSIFNSDKLRLKEFIQKSIGLENLSFISGGAIGLAFQWGDKVIKFTTDISEKEGVERMIEISPEGSKIPGFVKYYWIKEVRLPEGSWRKSGKNITADLEDKVINQRKISKTGQKTTLLSPEEVENRKSDKKMKTAFIICLEKIETLNKVDSEIAHFIYLLIKPPPNSEAMNYIGPNIKNDNRLKSLIRWLKSDEEEYKEPEYLKMGLDKVSIFSSFTKGLTKKAIFSEDDETKKKFEQIWDSVSESYFIEFANKMINIYEQGLKLGIPVSDIHEGNMGWRGDELVAFDCM